MFSDKFIVEKLEQSQLILSYKEALAQFESHWIEATMIQCKYNQCKAAAKLEMSRGTLRTKLRLYFGNKYFRDLE